jgi:hypothetical protein
MKTMKTTKANFTAYYILILFVSAIFALAITLDKCGLITGE